MQGNESDEFLSVFKDMGGVEYLDGGIESGFAHVERDTWPVRLLHVKGKYSVRVKEVCEYGICLELRIFLCSIFFMREPGLLLSCSVIIISLQITIILTISHLSVFLQ